MAVSCTNLLLQETYKMGTSEKKDILKGWKMKCWWEWVIVRQVKRMYRICSIINGQLPGGMIRRDTRAGGVLRVVLEDTWRGERWGWPHQVWVQFSFRFNIKLDPASGLLPNPKFAELNLNWPQPYTIIQCGVSNDPFVCFKKQCWLLWSFMNNTINIKNAWTSLNDLASTGE